MSTYNPPANKPHGDVQESPIDQSVDERARGNDDTLVTDGGTCVDGTDHLDRLKQKQGITTEYGVDITLERDSHHIWAGRYVQYWSPAPTSEEEAIEAAKEEYDGEIAEVRGVETREVPAPAKWSDDDPRIRSVDADTDHSRGELDV